MGSDNLQSPKPLVSVVLPAFNAADTLGQTLNSVLAQTYANLEIVVVDDGSTDSTPKVLQAYESRVRSVRQQNAGLASARNTGCRMAKGEFIALMDSDDLCAPDRLSVQLQVFQKFPHAILCGSDFSAFNSSGQLAESYATEYYSELSTSSGGLASKYSSRDQVVVRSGDKYTQAEDCLIDVFVGSVYPSIAFGNFVHPPTVMLRREALMSSGLFDESIRYNSDWELFVRLARMGPFVHVCRSLLAYRLSDNQMSSSRGNRGKGAADLVQAFDKICRLDPTLSAVERDRVRKHRRQFAANAARALVEHDRAHAARMLAVSALLGGVDGAWGATFAKLFMPAALLGFLRRNR